MTVPVSAIPRVSTHPPHPFRNSHGADRHTLPRRKLCSGHLFEQLGSKQPGNGNDQEKEQAASKYHRCGNARLKKSRANVFYELGSAEPTAL